MPLFLCACPLPGPWRQFPRSALRCIAPSLHNSALTLSAPVLGPFCCPDTQSSRNPACLPALPLPVLKHKQRQGTALLVKYRDSIKVTCTTRPPCDNRRLTLQRGAIAGAFVGTYMKPSKKCARFPSVILCYRTYRYDKESTRHSSALLLRAPGERHLNQRQEANQQHLPTAGAGR